jgi:hypothetical protein
MSHNKTIAKYLSFTTVLFYIPKQKKILAKDNIMYYLISFGAMVSHVAFTWQAEVFSAH